MGASSPSFGVKMINIWKTTTLKPNDKDELPHIAGIDKPGGAAPFNLHVDAGMDSYTNCNKQGTKKENLHNKKQFSDVNSQKETLF